jgi:hypothetical protein
MAEANYDDMSLFEQFSDKVQKDFEDSQNSEFEKEPITYPVISKKTTTWKFRFHPIIKVDPESGRPKLVLTRSVWSHSGFDKTRRLPCGGKECIICAETKKLKEIKHADAWKYSAKREAIALVHIFESTAPKDYKWQILNGYSFIQLRSKAIDSLNAFLSNLSPEEMKTVLNPKVKAPRLMFTVSGGSEGSASWSFDLKQVELPEIPEDFKYDIDTVYLDETKPITEEELKTVKITVNKLLATASGTLVEPEGEDGNSESNSEKAQANQEQAKSAVAGALGKAKETPAAAKEEAQHECPGKAEGLSWGEHPVAKGGEVSIACLSCPHEGDDSTGCIQATNLKHNPSK